MELPDYDQKTGIWVQFFYLIQLKNVSIYIGESPNCLSISCLPLKLCPCALHIEVQLYLGMLLTSLHIFGAFLWLMAIASF